MTRLQAILALSGFSAVGCGGDVRLGPGTYAEEVRVDGPVLWLRLDDGEGPIAHDELDIHDATYPSTGLIRDVAGAVVADRNAAVSLSGVSSLRLPPGLDFAGTSPFTLELWVKPARYDEQTGVGFVLDHQSYEPRSGYTLRVSGDDVALERWAGDSTFGSNATDPHPLALDTWHHVAATFDGKSLELYVDGRHAASNGVPTPMPPMTDTWTLGGPNCDCSANFFAGALDEVALYDRSLSPERVHVHFAASGR